MNKKINTAIKNRFIGPIAFLQKIDRKIREYDIKQSGINSNTKLSENEMFLLSYNNERIIDYLFKNNIINANHVCIIKNYNEIFYLCLKYNRKDLLKYLDKEIVYSDIKILDKLLELNIIPNTLNGYDGFNLEQINIILKYGKYDLLKKTTIDTY